MDTIASKDLGTQEGFAIRASIHPDIDSVPWEFDCYTRADVAAWKANKWHYVVVRVSASIDGHELGFDALGGVHHGSLAGVECDALNDDHPIKEHDMIATAIIEGRKAANGLRIKLDAIEPWPTDAPDDV